MTKTALICGVSGQDGALLAQFLIAKGYAVWGTSRDAQGNAFSNLVRLGIKDKVNLLSMVPEDFRSVLVAFKRSNATEIYFLAGQSSVALSFEQPAETMQSFAIGTLNILEAAKMSGHPVKVYNAASSECFGDTSNQAADENTSFNPSSPYAVAKATSYWLVKNYRHAYNLFACNGILFNHESSLRPERFVTQKIIKAVKRISEGSSEKLVLGRLDIARDWGWAPEYVEAMWSMMQAEISDDYVIATGQTNSLEQFVALAFEIRELDWRHHTIQDETLMRPSDNLQSRANPDKARVNLGWQAKLKLHDVVREMSRACDVPQP
jgi:GDPmannose 4,6-dehydratase